MEGHAGADPKESGPEALAENGKIIVSKMRHWNTLTNFESWTAWTDCSWKTTGKQHCDSSPTETFQDPRRRGPWSLFTATRGTRFVTILMGFTQEQNPHTNNSTHNWIHFDCTQVCEPRAQCFLAPTSRQLFMVARMWSRSLHRAGFHFHRAFPTGFLHIHHTVSRNSLQWNSRSRVWHTPSFDVQFWGKQSASCTRDRTADVLQKSRTFHLPLRSTCPSHVEQDRRQNCHCSAH